MDTEISSPLDGSNLVGKTALVTGAGKGIGRTIALVLAEAGTDVAIAARTESDLDEVSKEIRDLGREAIIIPTDVSKSCEVDRMVESAMDKFGKIDILVNNAGILHNLPLVPPPNGVPASQKLSRTPDHPITNEEWDHLLDTNLNGVMYCCRAVAPHMLKRRSGKIINVSSVLAKVALPYTLTYNVSKAAVNMLTRVLALEWAEYGVQVNAICPGSYETNMSGDMWSDPEKAQRAADFIPMGRPGNLRELGLLAAYLASSASDYMTGQTIYSDGGIAAR